jgi:formylglycine-generating enzyme required for sulfatase activity
MKKRKLYYKGLQLWFFFIICFYIYSCENSSESQMTKNYIPELIFIDQDITFTMGRLDLPNWTYTNETEVPSFKAILSPYYIGKYEVRNDEYIYFVKDGGYNDSTLWSEAGWKYIKMQNRNKPVDWIEGDEPWSNCTLSNTPDRPINNICWYEAEAYCNWLSKKTGDKYSLPTEAQWERAARGPDPGRPFPWGDEDDQTKLNNMMYTRKLYPVGSFEAGKSYDGCYDMTGNLEEFCSDWFELYIYKNYKENEPIHNPSGPDSNSTGQRSLRGTITIFHYDYEIEKQVTTFRRMACMPEDNYQIYGFRIVKNIY